jgi:3-deoxy-D-manno-octulosonic acid kinase
MSLDNNLKISKTGGSYILYDASIIAEPTLQLFNRDYHTNQSSRQSKSESNLSGEQQGGIGRAPVVYFSQGGKSFVLKHYYRGGAVASVLKDRYLGFSIIKSRAFREFRLLKKMNELGLPVPQAVAAHVEKALVSYRADLITEEIKNTKTLADVLSESSIDVEQWKKIGACIKLFHQNNVYHADLNARNILLAESMKIYLIDFDNSHIRVGPDSWKMANLSRLKRSLLKFKNNTDGFNFDEANWLALLDGYEKR